MVNNVTGLGVCIEFVFRIEELPETVDFGLDSFRTIHSCKIIRREGNIAGVAFEKPLSRHWQLMSAARPN
jgi:aryl carrier-like protein